MWTQYSLNQYTNKVVCVFCWRLSWTEEPSTHSYMALTKTIQSSHHISSKHWHLHYPPQSPMWFLMFSGQGRWSDHSYLSRAKFKNQWSYTSTQPVSLHGTYWDNFFYLYPLPIYISVNRSHPFWSYKGTLIYITYLLHAHCMNHLFNLHWSNYINTMNSSNNKPHYIIFLCPCYILPLYVRYPTDNFSQSSSKHVFPSM